MRTDTMKRILSALMAGVIRISRKIRLCSVIAAKMHLAVSCGENVLLKKIMYHENYTHSGRI